MANRVYTILAITDENTCCDCCGKTNLKKTVLIQINDEQPLWYGTSCAAMIMNTGIPAHEARWGKVSIEREATNALRKAENMRLMQLFSSNESMFVGIMKNDHADIYERWNYTRCTDYEYERLVWIFMRRLLAAGKVAFNGQFGRKMRAVLV